MAEVMAHRTRLAPPNHLRHLPTKLAQSNFDIMRLRAQGWTIVQANGHTDTDIKPEGMSTDPPKDTAERIERVLGEVPRGKRPRIKKTAQ